MDIRLRRSDEEAALLAIWERAARATHRFLSEDDIVAFRPMVAAELADATVGWWVLASNAERAIGFLGLKGHAIEALFIDPRYHRKGGGRALVAHVQRRVQGTLTVDVNEQNESALAFYRMLGFATFGRSSVDRCGRPFPLLHLARRHDASLSAVPKSRRAAAASRRE